jgi:hypothetical protein
MRCGENDLTLIPHWQFLRADQAFLQDFQCVSRSAMSAARF